jgi:transketolase
VVLVLTRQGVPVLDPDKYGLGAGVEKGAYVLSDPDDLQPEVILIATGSEVELALKAQEMLLKEAIPARVVSMPSWELFERQPDAYKEEVFPKTMKKRLAIEAGSPLGWHKYVTDEGDVLGMTTFGESAPAGDLYKEFGFTAERVVQKAKALLG